MGKTTSTVNIAAAAAETGVPVVVIDLDPQGNASQALGIQRPVDGPDVYDVLVDGVELSVAVRDTPMPNLRCVTASVDLAGAEVELVSGENRESRLRTALSATDWPAETLVLIDCPPSLGLLTVNALVAADELFVPIQAEFYALDGVGQLIRTMELVRTSLNPDLEIGLVALTMLEESSASQDQVADEVSAYFGDRLAETGIPRDGAASSAPARGRTVLSADPTSGVAMAYRALARELVSSTRRPAQEKI